MAKKEKLPLGIENFEEMRTRDYYYVDKTGLIRTLLENPGKVNLFTRPRRFGKTLTMSTLKYFFEVGREGTLFDGLEISQEKDLCKEFMGKFPVISVTLKGATGTNFAEARSMVRRAIGNEAMRFQFLLESERLTKMEQSLYESVVNIDKTGAYTMSDELLKDSLQVLSRLLEKHYGKKVIMLIDEYDVPLDKAYQSGYYEEMVELIRTLFGNALKTNESLDFAVLTGCLRISKESIFTGLNNFNVYTVKDVHYNEYFGFSDGEVRELLEYYGFMGKYDAIKEWYDGYRFGKLEIYCPWDVVCYCHALKMDASMVPQNYWVNTSSNGIVRKLIEQADEVTRKETELLVNGRSIKKKLRQELTYRDMDSDIDNLWSILFTTGYLTQCGQDDGGLIELVIPNREIQWIFEEQIWEWMKKDVRKDLQKLESFCKAFEEGNTEAIESGFNSYLRKTISLRDNSVRKDTKENFYHGILLGLFAGMEGWLVQSNAESGEGYSDISIEIGDKDIGIVIELKYAQNAAFDEGCRKALQQIRDRNYEEDLLDDGMKIIRRYGIACYKKRCKVVSE
ncbi:MAG: ATP-binding protein [Lachnospiraceae bacterium]|nr:ATP-binding protein [Lachnospiraceae bacterium]